MVKTTAGKRMDPAVKAFALVIAGLLAATLAAVVLLTVSHGHSVGQPGAQTGHVAVVAWGGHSGHGHH